VVIRTKGTLEDSGEPVDINDQVRFAAGEGDVVQGNAAADNIITFIISTAWDLVVSLMSIGEVCLVKTSSRFAYGEFGRWVEHPNRPSVTVL